MSNINAANGIGNTVTDYITTQTVSNSGVQNINNTTNELSQTAASTSGSNINFSDIMAEMLRNEQMRLSTMAAMPGSSSIGMPGVMDSTLSMDKIFLAASADNNISSAQLAIAVLMMMMMGQSGESSSDMSMLSMMMSAVLSQLENNSSNTGNNPLANSPFIDPLTNPFAAEYFDVNGFRVSGTALLGDAAMPLNVSLPATPVITSTVYNRSPERYRAVIDQFRVETAGRYEPGRNGFTYCNIFVLDVTRAMGVHIPHLGAINMDKWLSTTGVEYGWREVNAETAQAYANLGRPAVTTSGDRGHVQMVVPSNAPFDPVRGVSIAQAGRINTNYAAISEIYGQNILDSQIRYFIHD